MRLSCWLFLSHDIWDSFSSSKPISLTLTEVLSTHSSALLLPQAAHSHPARSFWGTGRAAFSREASPGCFPAFCSLTPSFTFMSPAAIAALLHDYASAVAWEPRFKPGVGLEEEEKELEGEEEAAWAVQELRGRISESILWRPLKVNVPVPSLGKRP